MTGIRFADHIFFISVCFGVMGGGMELIMIIETKFLGHVEVGEKELLRFPRGLYGFEEAKTFALLRRSGDEDNPFFWMQCAEKKEPCFVVADPKTLFSDYNPLIAAAMAESIGLKSEDALRFLAIVHVDRNGGRIVLNLKCPVIINAAVNIAAQVILEESPYPIDYTISGAGRGTGAYPCLC